MLFDTKIALVIRCDLASWQKMNVAAFLASGIAAAIRAWAERETFGVRMHINVVREKNPDGTTVEVNVISTGGYSGPGTFFFTIQGGLIERLVIR
jgi:hypothetical protein